MLLTRNRFIVQQDTPSSYSGQTGLFTRVNAGEDALEFAAAAGVFLGLSDTPSSYAGQTGLFTRVNAAEDALEFAAGAGVTNFLGLTDTPASYAAQRFLVPRVNAAEGALEFINERAFARLDDIGGVTWGIPGWSWQGTAGVTISPTNRLYYIPMYVERRRTYTLIGFHVSAVTAGTFRLGIYEADFDGSGDLTPGALVLDAGAISFSTTGQKSIAITQQLDPRPWYFLVIGGNSTPALLGPNFNLGIVNPVTGSKQTITAERLVIPFATVADGSVALLDPAPAPTALGLAAHFAVAQLGE